MAPKAKPNRRCLASRCSAEVHVPDVFCPSHWDTLPPEMRTAIWSAIGSGDRQGEVALVVRALGLVRNVSRPKAVLSDDGLESGQP